MIGIGSNGAWHLARPAKKKKKERKAKEQKGRQWEEFSCWTAKTDSTSPSMKCTKAFCLLISHIKGQPTCVSYWTCARTGHRLLHLFCDLDHKLWWPGDHLSWIHPQSNCGVGLWVLRTLSSTYGHEEQELRAGRGLLPQGLSILLGAAAPLRFHAHCIFHSRAATASKQRCPGSKLLLMGAFDPSRGRDVLSPHLPARLAASQQSDPSFSCPSAPPKSIPNLTTGVERI